MLFETINLWNHGTRCWLRKYLWCKRGKSHSTISLELDVQFDTQNVRRSVRCNLFIIEFVNSISILLVYEVFRNVIRVLNIPKIHTTKNRHLKQLQLFQISMAKDTGPKTALFGWPPKRTSREVVRSDSGLLNVAHMLMSVSILANGQVSLWKVRIFFDGAKKECYAWCDAQNGSFGVHVHGLESYGPFRCCFSSDEYCIASCFMHPGFHFTKRASQLQASSGHSSKHHLESTISALVFSDTQNTCPTQHSRWGNG